MPAMLAVAGGTLAQQGPAEAPEVAAERYAASVRRIEQLQGAYAPALGEALLALGEAQRAAGQLDAAAATLLRCLHVMRVNHGLYSLAQLPALEALIDTERARGAWDRVNDAYVYMYWLYRRNYEPGDPRWLPVLKRLYEWHTAAYGHETGWPLTRHFYTAQELYHRGLELAERVNGDRRSALCFWHEECCREPAVHGIEPGGCPAELRRAASLEEGSAP